MFAKDAKPMDPASTTITPATAREGYVGFHWRSLGKTFRLRWSFGAIFCRPKQHDIEVKLFKNRSSQRARSVKIQQVVRCQAKIRPVTKNNWEYHGMTVTNNNTMHEFYDTVNLGTLSFCSFLTMGKPS